MATLASEILSKAAIQLVDPDHTRWPLAELLGWLNQSQRVIVAAKPSAYSASRVLALDAGAMQRLPATHEPPIMALIRVTRNITSDVADWPRVAGHAVRMTSAEALDSADPDWQCRTTSALVRQAAYDAASPHEFIVYPPNDGTGRVEVIVSLLPPTIEPTAANSTAITDFARPIALGAEYEPALLDYILFRAFSKDDMTAVPMKAQMHIQLLSQFLGAKVAAEPTSSKMQQGGA